MRTPVLLTTLTMLTATALLAAPATPALASDTTVVGNVAGIDHVRTICTLDQPFTLANVNAPEASSTGGSLPHPTSEPEATRSSTQSGMIPGTGTGTGTNRAAQTSVTRAAGTATTEPTPDITGTGAHTASAVPTDQAGQSSPASADRSPTVDPAAAAVAPPAPVITSPTTAERNSSNLRAITGTGVAGDTVSVTMDGIVIGVVPVSAEGIWSVALSTPLTEGIHTIGASQSDPAGHESAAVTVDVLVDRTAPSVPVIGSPVDGERVVADIVVSGRGEPGSSVVAQLDGLDSLYATIDDDGLWSVAYHPPFPSGRHQLTARATDGVGNVSELSAAITILVGSKRLAITSPAENALVSPTPTISGTGEPGGRVTLAYLGTIFAILLPSDVLGVATVGADGTWLVTLADPLGPGTYRVVAEQVADLGGGVDCTGDGVSFRVAALSGPPATAPLPGRLRLPDTGSPAGLLLLWSLGLMLAGAAALGFRRRHVRRQSP